MLKEFCSESLEREGWEIAPLFADEILVKPVCLLNLKAYPLNRSELFLGDVDYKTTEVNYRAKERSKCSLKKRVMVGQVEMREQKCEEQTLTNRPKSLQMLHSVEPWKEISCISRGGKGRGERRGRMESTNGDAPGLPISRSL